ncbi:hypothetical protein K3163_05540 [Qipengyuania sp. 1NDW9]|uniref:hypothetical protein n=1 Tax=Qipengyuania xiapuensis TaxID=2867236 RepID=UPI001C885B29|nr:hypothetical protein [Qipengyuania xiapuensis]MBX7492665.1 hypothetical protein [Qipengyuania xiapuensis]
MAKANYKPALMAHALGALRAEGYELEKKAGRGQAQNYLATRGDETLSVCIRTTQDGFVNFTAADAEGNGWKGLDDADAVVIAALDNPERPSDGATIYMVSDLDRVRNLFRKEFSRVLAKRGSPIENRTTWRLLSDVVGKDAKVLDQWDVHADVHADDAVDGSDAPKAEPTIAPATVPAILDRARDELAKVLNVASDKVTVRFEVAS